MTPPFIPTIWCDNLNTLSLVDNPICHAQTKHLELDLHFVRGHILARQMQVHHILFIEQPANILTKPLSINQTKLSVFILPLSLSGDIKGIYQPIQINHRK